ncbi:TonB-dependent receptor [Desulfobacter sp.]|uniref:TonB-dependent receptor n=1 Tax=Desulfobacter sp. TaxID=2294 RepID=UPI003D139E6C
MRPISPPMKTLGYRLSLFGAGCFIVLCLLQGTWAADSGLTRDAGTGTGVEPAKTSNGQTPEKEKDAVLSDIIVTGEKVDKTVLDSGASVQVYDAERLKTAVHATEISDLLKMTPNIVDVGNGNFLPVIRGSDGAGPGRGAVAFVTGTRPRLNMSLDGRSLTYNEVAFGPQSLWDVERVEVFLGPQSYIQGRNSIAGAVILESKDPAFDWEEGVKFGFGEQSYLQTAAYISGPVVKDELALRVSVDRQTRESFTDLTSYDPAGDPREIEVTTARAKLLYLPSALPELETKLTVQHFDTRAPQSEAEVAPEGSGSKFSGPRPVWETESTSGIWDLGWRFNQKFNFENKLIYTGFSNDRLTLPSDSYASIDGDEFQVEPLLRYTGDGSLVRTLFGLRYFNASQDEFVNIYGGSTFDDETETASAFGEITYAVIPRVEVTVGGRFEHEHHERKGGGQGLNYGGTIYNVQVDFDETYSVFLPKLDMAWKVKDNHTLGAKAAKGYRAGSAGITFDVPWTSYAFDEEYVWTYELYTRHRLCNDTLELTANIFYNDYEDMQLPYYINSSAVTIINADEAQSYGAEASVRWMPVRDLELFGGIGLVKTEIKQISIESYIGNELPRSPGYTANIGVLYKLPCGFDISGNINFKDAYYSYYDNDEQGAIDDYWTADLQLGYNISGWGFVKNGRVTLFARNLFDQDQIILIEGNDTDAPLKQRPRMVGMSVELNF